MNITIEDRVKAGAKFLDEEVPGWESNFSGPFGLLNLNRLDISCPDGCTLAVATRKGYDEALKEFCISDHMAVLHGFDVSCRYIQEKNYDEYALLTKAWKKEINRRKKEIKNKARKQRKQTALAIQSTMYIFR